MIVGADNAGKQTKLTPTRSIKGIKVLNRLKLLFRNKTPSYDAIILLRHFKLPRINFPMQPGDCKTFSLLMTRLLKSTSIDILN